MEFGVSEPKSDMVASIILRLFENGDDLKGTLKRAIE
jgi:hypothetical protein